MGGRTMTPVKLRWNMTPFKNNPRTGCFKLTKPSLTLASWRGEGQPQNALRFFFTKEVTFESLKKKMSSFFSPGTNPGKDKWYSGKRPEITDQAEVGSLKYDNSKASGPNMRLKTKKAKKVTVTVATDDAVSQMMTLQKCKETVMKQKNERTEDRILEVSIWPRHSISLFIQQIFNIQDPMLDPGHTENKMHSHYPHRACILAGHRHKQLISQVVT